MSVIDIYSVDEGQQLEELDFAGVDPMYEGPDYEQLLTEEAEIEAGCAERQERSAFEDGVEIGKQLMARDLLEVAPGGFSCQADAARWARWAVHKLNRTLADPRF